MTGVRMDSATPESAQPIPGGNDIRTAKRILSRLPDHWPYMVAGPLVLIAVWSLVANMRIMPELFLPHPSSVGEAYEELFTEGYAGHSLPTHAADSLRRVLLGFGIGSVAGVFLGLFMGFNRKVQAIFDPIVEFFRPLPPLAYLTLLIVWFGIGETPKIMVLFFTALPIMTVSAMSAVRGVSQTRIRAAQSLGAHGWKLFRYVIFPACLPEIFTGLRVAIGAVYATIIAAEMVAATSGLGWMVFNAGQFLRSDLVFAGIFMLGVVALLLDRAIRLIDKEVVHWQGRD